MYALVENNEIKQIIRNPKSMVIGDVRYPAKIFQLWTTAEKEAIGIYEVVVNKTNYKDPAYYINTNSSHTFADNSVTESWGTATAKNLDDVLVTQQDIDDGKVFDKEVGDVQIEGLKTIHKRNIKKQASTLLFPTDWYVIKATEVADYNVPSNVTTYRANVRTKSNEMETSIDNCTTVDQLKALYEYTNTGTEENPVFTRPLGEFPEEI